MVPRPPERGTSSSTRKKKERTETGPRLAEQNSPLEKKTESHHARTDTCSAGESQRPARAPSVNQGTPAGSRGHRMVPSGSSGTWTFAPRGRAARGSWLARMRGAQGSQLSALGCELPPASQQASVAHRLPHAEPRIYRSISLLLTNLSCFIMMAFSCSGAQTVWVLKGLARALFLPSALLLPGPDTVSHLKSPHEGPSHD